MAEEGHYHFNATIITRGGGDNAVRSAAYRAGEKLKDQRTGKVYDRSDRAHEIIHSEIIAPDNAPEWVMDRERLWNEVEAREDKSTRRNDAQLAREIDIAIPHQLPEEERIAVIRDFVREQFVKKGMVADVAWHAPPEQGDERNYHAHIMLTMREIGPDGFGNKGRKWNSDILIRHWREQWAVSANRALERAGLDIRLDHRTLEERGIDREATTHCGPAKTDKKRRKNREAQKARTEEQAQTLDEPAPKPQVRRKLYPTEEGVRRVQVQDLIEAHDHVMSFRAQEQQARYAGERQREARRTLSNLDWRAGQEEQRIREQQERFEKALEIAYAKPKEAAAIWQEHADNWRLDELHARGPKALGRLRGFAMLGFKTKERHAAEQAARQLKKLWKTQRQTRLRMEQLDSQRAIARAQFDRTARDYTSARNQLGDHKQRARLRQELYSKRAAALTKLNANDIWETNLPEEQKHELAAEWEEYNIRNAERAAEAERVTPRHKRDEWTGLWDEERKNDPALQKQRTETDPERQKKASMWEALDEAAKRDDENIGRIMQTGRKRKPYRRSER